MSKFQEPTLEKADAMVGLIGLAIIEAAARNQKCRIEMTPSGMHLLRMWRFSNGSAVTKSAVCKQFNGVLVNLLDDAKDWDARVVATDVTNNPA